MATSSYARQEFKRAWVRDLAYLHSKALRAHRFEEVLAEINDTLAVHPATRRRFDRCLQAITAFLGSVPPATSYSAQLCRFRAHLAQAILGADLWWERSVHYEFDGTGCGRALRRPERSANGHIDVSLPNCRPGNVRCRIAEFFEQHREAVGRILAEIARRGEQTSDELKATAGVMRAAADDPRTLENDKSFAKLGDCIIALDGKDMEVFAANNDAEWGLLSEALGKKLINPVRDAKCDSE